MRRWFAVFQFVLLLLHIWAQEDELVAKRIFLKTPASFVNLTSESWKLTADTDEVLIAVRFRAQSAVGRVLSSKFLRQDGSLETELVLSLEGGQLQVDLFDSDGQNILAKPFVNIYMNESSEHSVAVRINSLEKQLFYTVEQRAEPSAEITKDIQWAGAEVMTTLGGGPRSVIGCVALVTVQINGKSELAPLAHVVVLQENEIDKCQTQSECEQRNCGKGQCLALEVPFCDCFRTGKTGPNCANEPKTVELNNNDEDVESKQASIIFTPWKEDQKLRRIAMEFKFKDTYEGVILYGALEGANSLKMYSVQNLGTLDIGDNKMNFTLGPNNEYHSMAIFLTNEGLTLDIDGFQQSMVLSSPLLISSLIFGASPSTNEVSDLGLTACVRNIYVDHLDVLEIMSNRDSRVITSKQLKPCSEGSSLVGSQLYTADVDTVPADEEEQPPGEVEEDDERPIAFTMGGIFGNLNKNADRPQPCEKAQEYLCRNGATCLRGSSRPVCHCAPGYGGAACQFSLFPRTCAEAKQFHRLPEGPTRLDVDGSDDLSMSVAECQEGRTIIPHDMPENMAIRAAEVPKHGLFILSYLDFTPAKLENLISLSGNCRQQVNYKCNHAPLQFTDNRTWFRVASGNATLSQLGAVPNGCQCIDIGCVNQARCNCDAGSIAADEGVLQGKQAGIISIVALHRDGDVSGTMTISNLECSGYMAELNAIRFQKSGTYSLDEWNRGTLSFHFRTASPSGTLFTIAKGDEKVFQLELLDGHSVKAIAVGGEIVVESQAKLNDTRWHLIVIEWINEELRVSIDSTTAFKELKKDIFGNVTLGDLDKGIIGCFRSIIIGSKVSELKGSIDGITFDRCDDKCATATCQNGAECLENFATGNPECSCKYPRLHSGKDCSHDINSDSSVSFHGGFLKFENLPLPLTSSWLFSFRTDQSSALLLYVHDENNNFLQLHLRDEVNVTLSLNNGGVVYSCTVQAPPGTEYSDMRWIQVYIDHGPTGSILTVEDEACSIRAGRLLANEPQRIFANAHHDLVKPPVGIDDVHKKFVYTFIGGVQREDKENFKLQAVYSSRVEDFLGCVRGVKVGEKVLDIRKKSKEEGNNGLIQVGCDVKCESLSCKNGGHCSVAWKDFNPASTKTTCDCSRTSYAGPYCLQDDGVSFVYNQSFKFDLGAVIEKYIIESTPPVRQTLKFAFSADTINYRQMMAILYFQDASEFEVLLNKNGSLHTGILFADGRSTVLTFKGNFTDGYRHFFVAQFGKNFATRVYVDGVRQDFSSRSDDNHDLFNSRLLWLGGQRVPPSFESGVSAKKNLQGCISNVNMDFGVKLLNLWPFSYLNSDNPYANLTVFEPPGNIKTGQCASFRVPNQVISPPNTVSLPVWETNFRRQEYKHAYDDNEDNGGLPWWLIILGVFLLIICIVLIILVIFLCRKGHKDSQPQNISLDEREPLRQTQFPQTPPIGTRPIHSNYAVPLPDIQLPSAPRVGLSRLRENEHSRSSPRHSLLSQPDSLATTAYFTAQEDFSDVEDIERTLTPGSDITIFDDEINRNGFNRSSPQRLSSFRDSSAPMKSPLYAPEKNGRRLRPVDVPKPPQRTSPV